MLLRGRPWMDTSEKYAWYNTVSVLWMTSGSPNRYAVQLWTDNSTKEFAIRLSTDPVGDFRSATNLSSEYRFLVVETGIGKMNTNGWGFMLGLLAEEWIKNSPSTDRTGIQSNTATEDGERSNKHSSGAGGTNQLVRKLVRAKGRSRPRLQCHFCKLCYYGESDRTEHELMWHPDRGAKNVVPRQSRGQRIASSIS